MKRVQPKIDEIKKRFEGDPKRLREEQAKIMQEEKAFPPLGGCLPIFIQMPIFFGLFSMLRTSFDLRQAGFALWIDDLSQPDRLMELGIQLPLLGDYLQYLNLLPPLMVLLWILQQRGMPQPADEQARRMQRIMMWMPVFMGVFLYNYAAGLSLYMITQSTLGIFEQRVIKKLWPIDDTEAETKSGCGCGPFSGIMENLAEKQKTQMKLMQERQRHQQSKGGKQQRPKKKR
jgi:YidC/Oxa1 family membrane protein insertase